MDVNPRSPDTAVSLPGHCSNGVVRLVYRLQPIEPKSYMGNGQLVNFGFWMDGGGGRENTLK